MKTDSIESFEAETRSTCPIFRTVLDEVFDFFLNEIASGATIEKRNSERTLAIPE